MISGFKADNNYIYVIYLSRYNEIKIKRYDYITLSSNQDYTLKNDILDKNDRDIFKTGVFKSIYLKDKKAALIYFTEETSLNFLIFDLESNYEPIIEKSIEILDIFPSSQTMNDLIKITDERLLFITANNNKINFIFLDLYNNYNKMKLRYYSYYSDYYTFDKEFCGYNYNDYLMFTITAIPNDLGEGNFISLLMIFGYANGTDNEIDISPYLSDNELYNSSINLIHDILNNITIDNNIFGYKQINQIKLINIPEQIKFYDTSNPEQELINGDLINENYILKQNNILVKNNTFYSLEYQYILTEQNYNDFYSTSNQGYNNDNEDVSLFFVPLKFYGRTNTLKFKLCHKYCDKCQLLGTSINDQKCESCLLEYQYDYYNLSKTNCVPEWYFYNKTNNKIEKCNIDAFEFKRDEISNKIFCFPHEVIITTQPIPIAKYSNDNSSFKRNIISFSNNNNPSYKYIRINIHIRIYL